MSAVHMKLAAVAWLLAAGAAALVQAADVAPGVGPADPLTALPDRGALNVRGAVYVPAYSSVLIDRGRLRIDFSVTLCIHNASAEKPLVVERILFYDVAGTLVQDYLRANFLSHRVWVSNDAIVDPCCNSWNRLMNTPERLASITRQTWAKTVIG